MLRPNVRDVLRDLLGQLQPRAKSLIVTVYGDAILPFGGEAWLGDLIELMEPLGVGERLVRTSVFRLTQDGMLTARQIGRRSIYALTYEGRAEFDAAQRRIYAPISASSAPMDVPWQIVLLPADLEPATKSVLKRDLQWAGFGTFGPQVLIGVGAKTDRSREIIADHGLNGAAWTFDATPQSGTEMLEALCREAWPLYEVDEEYKVYIRTFAPLQDALANAPVITGAEAFALRILTIHGFRRTLLKDPGLPAEMMHEGWSAPEARALTAQIYRHLAEPARDHIERQLTGTEGPLRVIDKSALARFRDAA